MSAVSSTAAKSALVVGGEPRVDLLPPEVRLARRGAATRRMLLLLLVVCVVLVAGGYFFGTAQVSAANARLEAQQAATTSLLAQQQKYIQVRQVGNSISSAEAASRVGMSTEVDWATFLTSLSNTLPAGSSVNGVTLDSATPTKAFGQATTPLAVARIASVQLIVSVPDLNSAQSWIAGLSGIPGVADVGVSSVQSGEHGYDVTVLISVSDKVLAHPLNAKVSK
jgi:Tfp pilus assembly protein PilN